MSREAWGTIRQLPSGNYQAQTPVIDGHRIKAPNTFRTRNEARTWLLRAQVRIADGEDIEQMREEERVVAHKVPTMQQVFVEMLTQMEQADYSPNTIRTYRSSWVRYLQPDIGGMPVTKMTSKWIVAWDAGMKWEAQNTRRKATNLLKRMLTYAADAGYIEQVPRVRLAVANRQRRTKYLTATPQQLAAIREGMPRELAVTIDLAGWCALRFGEIAALRGGDIDVLAGTVRVTKSTKRGIGGAISEGPVKTLAGNRTVAIPPVALERIKQHLDEYGIGTTDLVVWQPGSQGKAWLRNKELHSRFDPVVKSLGLEGLRFHDLRHTGLTLAGEAGATLAELMARAGHSDVGAAMIYQHASLERDRALAAKLGG